MPSLWLVAFVTRQRNCSQLVERSDPGSSFTKVREVAYRTFLLIRSPSMNSPWWPHPNGLRKGKSRVPVSRNNYCGCGLSSNSPNCGLTTAIMSNCEPQETELHIYGQVRNIEVSFDFKSVDIHLPHLDYLVDIFFFTLCRNKETWVIMGHGLYTYTINVSKVSFWYRTFPIHTKMSRIIVMEISSTTVEDLFPYKYLNLLLLRTLRFSIVRVSILQKDTNVNCLIRE